MTMDYIIKTDGKKIKVAPEKKTYSLEELQSIVGGYIEIVWLSQFYLMVVNEEGKLNGLPMNDKATDLLRLCKDTTDFIVGDVLVCEKDHID